MTDLKPWQRKWNQLLTPVEAWLQQIVTRRNTQSAAALAAQAIEAWRAGDPDTACNLYERGCALTPSLVTGLWEFAGDHELEYGVLAAIRTEVFGRRVSEGRYNLTVRVSVLNGKPCFPGSRIFVGMPIAALSNLDIPDVWLAEAHRWRADYPHLCIR